VASLDHGINLAGAADVGKSLDLSLSDQQLSGLRLLAKFSCEVRRWEQSSTIEFFQLHSPIREKGLGYRLKKELKQAQLFISNTLVSGYLVLALSISFPFSLSASSSLGRCRPYFIG
jgi:hypothetical protein